MKEETKILFISDSPPAEKESIQIKLAAKIYVKGGRAHLFSPVIPAAERLQNEYRHLDVFEKKYSDLKKAVLENSYEAAFFFNTDAMHFYSPLIKSLAANLKIFAFNVTEETSAAEYLENIFSGNMSAGEKKKVSIIMLTFNQLNLTKQCLDSIKRNTQYPYELIIVDNGSSDGTLEYLKKYQEDASNRTHCIFNGCNLAFSKANNIGIRKASGENILLINNDVVVTNGWLTGLVNCLNSDISAGAAGPCTNESVGAQKVEPGYDDLAELPRFADAFRINNAGKQISCHRLTAFCFLIKREVIDKIGLLDERFGPGGFEDYDYCLRIRQAGYKILLAADIYVHHVGGQGYKPNNLNYSDLRQDNKLIFINKWCRRALEIMETLPNG